MADEMVMEPRRKHARLAQQADLTPVVSLKTIFSLAKVTQKCFSEGEAIYNAGHIVCCGVREATQDVIGIEALCLQTSGLKKPPHRVNVDVHNGTGAVKVCNIAATFVTLSACSFFIIFVNRAENVAGTCWRSLRLLPRCKFRVIAVRSKGTWERTPAANA